MSFIKSIILASIAVFCLSGAVCAQTKRRAKSPVKKPAATNIAPATSPSPVEPVLKSEPKKNERPGSDEAAPVAIKRTISEPTYFYEFTQPDFAISRIVIEHDETGRGTIAFTRKMFQDSVTDPIELSTETMGRIRSVYAALNFVDSNETYQYEKDYSHLGVMTFRLKQAGKQRTAVFNFTTNKDAKVLADEYRKIANQFIWIFDLEVARANQPLETPKLLDGLESQLKRNELSDPKQLVTLLRGMVDDERVPLIARNHAGKLAEKIEKGRK